MKYSYSRERRLTRKADIDLAYRNGKRVMRGRVRFFFRRNDLDVSRLAISVPNKVGNAVERNRWKRLIREAFRLHPEIGPGLDILVVPLRPPENTRRQEVEALLLESVSAAR